MKNHKNFEYSHSNMTQKRVEEAESVLKEMYFELCISSRIFEECERNIHDFYVLCPDSTITSFTLVGCLIYLNSSKLNEHISLNTISEKIGVSTSWLSKKKRIIASILKI
ncbi:MAG: hypothetical protein EAX86_01835 [Candidatus Heimdallarchaeota archaeon]|nr:hypothetical protein [Candidatus Heimdallarchaeota archaeon]